MILDKLFKKLAHSFKGYEMYRNGSELVKGYKPDYVLRKGNDHVIFESEGATSRKTFLGGLVKAAHFLQSERTGSLIFVMVPKENITAISIQKHLKIYLEWLSDKTNLRDVYIIEDGHYYKNEEILMINGSEFLRLAKKV